MYYCAFYEKKLRQMDIVIQLVSKKKSETKWQYGVVIKSVGSAFKQSGFEFQLITSCVGKLLHLCMPLFPHL